MGDFQFNGSIPPGLYFEQSLPCRLPRTSGDYWAVVTADIENSVAENDEDNNTFISATPIHVNAEYMATVQTDVTTLLAGAPVPLYGTVTIANGLTPEGKLVNIHIMVRGIKRVISALADATGHFTATFTPLPGEAGHYTIAAAHPGASTAPVQDEFTILGMKLNPASVSLTIPESNSVSGSVSVQNLSEMPMTGLSAAVVGAPTNLSITTILSGNTLAGFAELTLSYAVTVNSITPPHGSATVRVTSAEGVTVDLLIDVTVDPLRARLVATPVSLRVGLVRGKQTVVEFDVANVGGASSEPIHVISGIQWMNVASTNPLPSLLPGQTNHVILQLTPPSDHLLGEYLGSVVLSAGGSRAPCRECAAFDPFGNCIFYQVVPCSGESTTVPIDFFVLSDAVGDLEVTAVDEYTYYAEGSPKVAGARVTLSDAVTGVQVATGVTDADGEIAVNHLPAAFYVLDVQADLHSSYRKTIVVQAGVTNQVQAFLSRQTVQYIWTVVPTEIEDRTRIEIQTVFETVVPIPVITVEPTVIDLASVAGPEAQIEVTIANHGLVAAKNMRLDFPPHHCWQLTPLVEDIGILGAQSSLTIPVTIRRVSTLDCGQCQFAGAVSWNLVCGALTNDYATSIQVINAGTNCGGPVTIGFSGGGGGGGGGAIGSAPGLVFVPPNIVVNEDCDCAARVKLQIDQDAVLTRDGFNATLEIVNGSASALNNVRVVLQVVTRATSGESTHLFQIRPPVLTGLSDVDGSGVVAANASGRASWIIVPTVDAAPTNRIEYLVRGALTYVQDGLTVTVPLRATTITVLPLAQLDVKYFHQRDVFSDDPFTPEREPSIPFSLGVLVQNKGFGTARNLRITSSQPEIIGNESGLLIDFNIIATEVTGQNITPSLTANFGNIDPGRIAIGRWLLTSTLQGLFIDYNATFEHIDGLGNPRLSLIENVEIHEMIHLARDQRSGADTLPDFLVNDVPDIDDRPDTIYLSDGSIAPVSVVEFGLASGAPSAGNLEVQLSLGSVPGGWVYTRVPDPANGQFRFIGVRRSDGTNLLADNFWTTDRTFIGVGRRPIRENILHLFDHDSTGSYTLIYAPVEQPDTTPPSSAVAVLPTQSSAQIPVQWTGVDNPGGRGLASFDIYVSVNNRAFTPWLHGTTLRGSFYDGVQGNTYAFYSVATDLAGNREQTPGTPDAETLVSITNSPPSIAISNLVVINEGQTLDLPFSANDPDADQNLTFALLPGAPAGMFPNFTGRRLTWPTGEGNGPSTNLIALVARDNGFPSLSATGQVTVVVNEVNSPPIVAVVTDRVISEGRLLSFAVSARDNDLPSQTLVFSLGGAAPAGATLGSTSGFFSWQPTEFQGGTNYLVSMIVHDNGTPSLSATQIFNLVVRDTQGDFALAIGSTNLFAGESNSVPFALSSGAELTDVAFILETDPARIGDLALQSLAPQIVSSSLQSLPPNQWQIRFVASALDGLAGSLTLGRLSFTAFSNERSVIVLLQASNVEGMWANGDRLANVRASSGRAFVIAREPIVDAQVLSSQVRVLDFYGHPNRRYAIEFAANLAPPVVWMPFQEIALEDSRAVLGSLPTSMPNVFFRARELPFIVSSNIVVRINGAVPATNSLTVTNFTLVELQTAFANGTILYTLNGAPPATGPFYTGPILLTDLAIVRAIAFSSDYTRSAESDPLVIGMHVAPLIAAQPMGQSAIIGQDARFDVIAGGTVPLSYQWWRNGEPVPGATSSSLRIGSAELADAGNYLVVVSNAYGRSISAEAMLTVLTPPGFAIQPANTNAQPGGMVKFCVMASGTPPLLYQWRKNGVNIPEATNACFTITNVQVPDGGIYSVVVANEAGAITSEDARLVVNVPPAPPSDNFVDRVAISNAMGVVSGANLFATKEMGEPNHAGKAGGSSVWYRWRTPFSGIATLNTRGSAFDTLLAIYTGTSVNALTHVAAMKMTAVLAPAKPGSTFRRMSNMPSRLTALPVCKGISC